MIGFFAYCAIQDDPMLKFERYLRRYKAITSFAFWSIVIFTIFGVIVDDNESARRELAREVSHLTNINRSLERDFYSFTLQQDREWQIFSAMLEGAHQMRNDPSEKCNWVNCEQKGIK